MLTRTDQEIIQRLNEIQYVLRTQYDRGFDKAWKNDENCIPFIEAISEFNKSLIAEVKSLASEDAMGFGPAITAMLKGHNEPIETFLQNNSAASNKAFNRILNTNLGEAEANLRTFHFNNSNTPVTIHYGTKIAIPENKNDRNNENTKGQNPGCCVVS